MWPDGDGDGFGNSDGSTADYCDVPATGWADNDSDCNDSDSAVGAAAAYYEDYDGWEAAFYASGDMFDKIRPPFVLAVFKINDFRKALKSGSRLITK